MLLTRRLFASCALCASAGLVAARVDAQTGAAPAITRTILQQTDGPADGYVSLLVRSEIAAGGLIPRHTHPGIESTFFLTGEGELVVKGQPDRQVKSGQGFQIPPYVPHSLQNGPGLSTIVTTYIVEKGKPLVTLAPE